MGTNRVITLVGLPGAGKTTVGIALARALGMRWVGLGYELRLLAQHDTALEAALGRGELAPETLVEKLVATAVQSAPDGLVLDGFPRHAAQVAVADRLLGQWLAIVLDLPMTLAQSRLATRADATGCRRLEDSSHTVQRRLVAAMSMLSDLVAAIPPKRLQHIDASLSFDATIERIRQLID